MESDVGAIVEFVATVLKSGGPWAACGVLLTGLLGVYRLATVQKGIAWLGARVGFVKKLLWVNFPEWLKLALPFGLACLGVTLPAIFVGGLGVGAAVVAGINAGLLAIGVHFAKKEAVVVVSSKPLPVNKDELVKKLMEKSKGK